MVSTYWLLHASFFNAMNALLSRVQVNNPRHASKSSSKTVLSGQTKQDASELNHLIHLGTAMSWCTKVNNSMTMVNRSTYPMTTRIRQHIYKCTFVHLSVE